MSARAIRNWLPNRTNANDCGALFRPVVIRTATRSLQFGRPGSRLKVSSTSISKVRNWSDRTSGVLHESPPLHEVGRVHIRDILGVFLIEPKGAQSADPPFVHVLLEPAKGANAVRKRGG